MYKKNLKLVCYFNCKLCISNVNSIHLYGQVKPFPRFEPVCIYTWMQPFWNSHHSFSILWIAPATLCTVAFIKRFLSPSLGSVATKRAAVIRLSEDISSIWTRMHIYISSSAKRRGDWIELNRNRLYVYGSVETGSFTTKLWLKRNYCE